MRESQNQTQFVENFSFFGDLVGSEKSKKIKGVIGSMTNKQLAGKADNKTIAEMVKKLF